MIPIQMRIREVSESGYMNVSFYPKCSDIELIWKLNASHVQMRVIPYLYLNENLGKEIAQRV
jgi:hypothetical protein